MCAAVLCGCWNGRVLFAAEEPYWAAVGGDPAVRWPLARASLAHGYIPRFLNVRVQQDGEATLRRELQIRRYNALVLGPLLALEQQGSPLRAARVLVTGDRTVSSQGTVVQLVFDRIPSFRTAGYAAGLSISDEAGGIATSVLASRIGILVSAHPPGTREEIAAFSDGVAQALDGGQPSMRSLSDQADRNAVRSAVEQMRRDGVEVFLLFLGVSDSWALDAMRNAGGCAVVADWSASGAFPRQVFLSVESDIVGGVARFLSRRSFGSVTIDGPVRLVAGKARPIPPRVAAQVAVH